jgi:hypothetical protein
MARGHLNRGRSNHKRTFDLQRLKTLKRRTEAQWQWPDLGITTDKKGQENRPRQ